MFRLFALSFAESITLKITKKIQVPKMEVLLTYMSCMDTAYVRETQPSK